MGSEKEKYTNETNFVSNLLVKTVQEIGGQTSFKLKYSSPDFETWVKINGSAEAEINWILENVQEARSDIDEYEYRTYQDFANCEGHEHCEICNVVISCKQDENEFYLTQRHLICPDCFKRYIKNDDYLKEIEGLEKFKNYR